MIEDFPLNIFTRMRDNSIEDFRPRLGSLEIGGQKIYYISASDLIALKQGSWREKDQIDVATLKEMINRG